MNTQYIYNMTGDTQLRNVACYCIVLPLKMCPLLVPVPFRCRSLKFNKLGDFREYAGKITKKCVSRAKHATLLVLLLHVKFFQIVPHSILRFRTSGSAGRFVTPLVILAQYRACLKIILV